MWKRLFCLFLYWSGKDLAAINRLLKQFEQSKQMMKQMSNMDSATGLPKMGGGHFVGGPNRKKDD